MDTGNGNEMTKKPVWFQWRNFFPLNAWHWKCRFSFELALWIKARLELQYCCLPRERQPRPQRRPRTPQLLQEGLCTAPAMRKAAANPKNAKLTDEVQQRDALPARPNTMTGETRAKKQKETSDDRAKTDWSNRAFWSKAFVQGNPRKSIRSPV